MVQIQQPNFHTIKRKTLVNFVNSDGLSSKLKEQVSKQPTHQLNLLETMSYIWVHLLSNFSLTFIIYDEYAFIFNLNDQSSVLNYD